MKKNNNALKKTKAFDELELQLSSIKDSIKEKVGEIDMLIDLKKQIEDELIGYKEKLSNCEQKLNLLSQRFNNMEKEAYNKDITIVELSLKLQMAEIKKQKLEDSCNELEGEVKSKRFINTKLNHERDYLELKYNYLLKKVLYF